MLIALFPAQSARNVWERVRVDFVEQLLLVNRWSVQMEINVTALMKTELIINVIIKNSVAVLSGRGGILAGFVLPLPIYPKTNFPIVYLLLEFQLKT